MSSINMSRADIWEKYLFHHIGGFCQVPRVYPLPHWPQICSQDHREIHTGPFQGQGKSKACSNPVGIRNRDPQVSQVLICGKVLEKLRRRQQRLYPSGNLHKPDHELANKKEKENQRN